MIAWLAGGVSHLVATFGADTLATRAGGKRATHSAAATSLTTSGRSGSIFARHSRFLSVSDNTSHLPRTVAGCSWSPAAATAHTSSATAAGHEEVGADGVASLEVLQDLIEGAANVRDHGDAGGLEELVQGPRYGTADQYFDAEVTQLLSPTGKVCFGHGDFAANNGALVGDLGNEQRTGDIKYRRDPVVKTGYGDNHH